MRSRIAIYLILFIFSFNLVYSTSVEYTDDWSADEGSTTDAVIWGGYNLDVYADSVNSYADCICWDWCDDGSDDNVDWSDWDQCDCESTSQRDDCQTYSSWVDNICDGGDCYINSDLEDDHSVTSGSSGDSWTCGIDIREYRDCDDSSGQQGIYNYEGDDGRPYWVVYPKKYDCDGCDWYTESCPTYDFEGDYSSGSSLWVDIKQDNDCPSPTEVCDENHDDDLVYTATGSISSPCRRDLGTSCSSDDQCASDTCSSSCSCCGDCDTDNDCTDPDLPYCLVGICNCGDDPDYSGQCDSCLDWVNGYSCDCDSECESNNCVSGTCTVNYETSCTDSTDNDGDGSTDCDDSDCEGQTGPGGKICCNDGAYDCGTCKYCSSDLCENRAVGYVCNSNYYCSDYPGGDNSYNTGSTRKIPSQGQCDASQNCDYSSSSPVCDLAEGTSQEGDSYNICQDGYSSCRDTCSDGIDNDGDGDTDSSDSDCGAANPCDNDYNCESGETPGNCPNDCVSSGSTCLYDEQCYDVDYCVHNKCRSTDPYCGDSYCDSGETCTSCSGDCGSCAGPEISIYPTSLTFYI